MKSVDDVADDVGQCLKGLHPLERWHLKVAPVLPR